MPQINWDDVRDEFVFDGSWRDAYVLETTLADWGRVLEAIHAAAYVCEYLVGGAAAPLPVDAASTFLAASNSRPLLTVALGGIQANCHFFRVDEIEFDIDPREVAGQRELDELVGFMHLLARSTGKPAIFTPENVSQSVILRVFSDGSAEFIRPGSERC